MVFKPFSTLARRSTKAFTHGYAQSLAAASQSSYASTQTPLSQFNHNRLGKPSVKRKESFHSHAIHTSVVPRLSPHAVDGHHDVGPDPFTLAWQSKQPVEEQKQYPSGKWVHSAGLPARLLEGDIKSGILKEPVSARRALPNIPAAEDAKAVQQETTREESNIQIDSAVASEPQSFHQHAPELSAERPSPSDLSAAATLVEDGSVKKAFSDEDASITDRSDVEAGERLTHVSSDAFEHIASLEAAGQFAQIPAVFSELHRQGIVAPTKTYNSLVLSAIRLSQSASQVVPKALDIYTDMLRRGAVPDEVTYTRLLELLCLKCLEVAEGASSLEQSKTRFQLPNMPSGFLLRSREAEEAIAKEDDSLHLALKLFDRSTADQELVQFPASVYRLLLEACAKKGENEQMIRIYSHMESHKVTPFASSYPAMIQAFASAGDLNSAVVCYNEYRDLAMADNDGAMSLLSRADEATYAAVVRAYLSCKRSDGAEEFIGKILISLQDPVLEQERQNIRDAVMVDGLVQQYLVNKDVSGALEILERPMISESKRAQATSKIIIAAADQGEVAVATKLYEGISDKKISRRPAIAVLAMHLRSNDFASARTVWSSIMTLPSLGQEMIEPTTAYVLASVEAGYINESLMQARIAYNNVRSSITAANEQRDAIDLIEESVEVISQHMARRGVVPSAQGAMSFLWAMVENGGLLTPVVEQLLAGIGPNEVVNLSWDDLKLIAQVEAGIVEWGNSTLDVAHFARFAHILETIVSSRMPVDARTLELVDAALSKVALKNPELIMTWNAYVRPQPAHHFVAQPQQSFRKATSYDSYDPYSNTLDSRGSSLLVDELERSGASSAASLNEALVRFRNIRRVGRHPRYIAYAKLITAAAKEGRKGLANEIFEMAKHDMPLLPEYPVVKHGWTTILDSMVGACLTLGDRTMAAEHHQQLLNIGSVPSANTFGLYITTLKESTKTFDEATEAVKIFLRAKAEGVEPTSFLYNALIGKLGKARRIDDCLFYFGEMRSRGIRPTSVTYGTIVNALCRVSDERFAEELFDEMESMPNYKPRAAPYNSMMQFMLNTKRDSSKVLEYYKRMQSRGIHPTMHTYKLLIDTYATLEPINLEAAEGVLDTIRRTTGQQPESVHYASLIHAKGCVLHDLAGARKIFESVVSLPEMKSKAGLYQAMFESLVANHAMNETDALLQDMTSQKVEMTPYIANTLIHGWAAEGNIARAEAAYNAISKDEREPSTYESMTRAYLVAEDKHAASIVVKEMLSRGYPSAVAGKVIDLFGGHGSDRFMAGTPALA